MNKSLLRSQVISTGSHFFERSSMRFFGDSMANYGVRAQPVQVEAYSGVYTCYELYRVRPVKHGLSNSTYFDVETFECIRPKQD